jgi:transcriptional regulator with PAS, ATPase and Fis domain
LYVFPIVLPPLKDRKEDIPILADHFIKKLSLKYNRFCPRLAPTALELLIQFDWPGNIRELENEIERAMTLTGDENEIKATYLSERIAGARIENVEPENDSGTLQEAIGRMERHMVERALRVSNGNRSQAARVLGLTRQGLLNKIHRYEINL